MENNVFISYSKNDDAIAKKLASQLKAQGISTWLDTNIEPGKLWADEIKNAIKSSSVMLVLVSKNYNESSWMTFERGVAYGLGKKIVPVLIDDSVKIPSDLAGFIYFSTGKSNDAELTFNIKKIIESNRNEINNNS
jgi:predicted nucleotide-binding protein